MESVPAMMKKILTNKNKNEDEKDQFPKKNKIKNKDPTKNTLQNRYKVVYFIILI